MRASLAALAILALLEPAAARADETLPNGLRVLVRPVAGAEKVAFALVFRVGEAHDDAGLSGLAHLAEHLFVMGASGQTAAGTVEDLAARYPDGWKAHTSWDYTLWGAGFPPARFDAELKALAARLTSVRADDASLEYQSSRVLEEIHGMHDLDGMPQHVVSNRAHDLLFPPAPGTRRGGTPASLEAIPLDLVNARLARWYRPRNAVLAIGGAVDPAAALAACRRILGPLEPGEPCPPPPPYPAPTARPGVLALTTTAEGVPPAGYSVACFTAPRPGSAEQAPFILAVLRLSQAARPAKCVFRYDAIEGGRALLVSTSAGPKALVDLLDAGPAAALAAPVTAAEAEIAASWVLGNPREQTEFESAYRAALLAHFAIDPDELRRRIGLATPRDIVRASPLGPGWRERAALVTLARPR